MSLANSAVTGNALRPQIGALLYAVHQYLAKNFVAITMSDVWSDKLRLFHF